MPQVFVSVSATPDVDDANSGWTSSLRRKAMATEVAKKNGKQFLAGRDIKGDEVVPPEDDFEQPNIVEGSPAAEELTLQEALPSGDEEQQDLPMDMPEEPKVIRNGKM